MAENIILEFDGIVGKAKMIDFNNTSGGIDHDREQIRYCSNDNTK